MSQEKDHLPTEALSPEEMEALAKSAVQAQQTNSPIDTSIIEKAKEQFVQKEEVKATTSGEEVRLPTLDQMQELRNIDRSQLEHTGTEVLHENVQVGTGIDTSYDPANNVSDTVMPEFQNIQQQQELAQARMEADKAAQFTKEVNKPQSTQEEYNGPGIVIEKKESSEIDPIKAALPPETRSDLEKYMEGMEQSMVEGKAIRDKMAEVNPNLQNPNDRLVGVDGTDKPSVARDATEESEEVQQRRAEEAMVVINKLEQGNITFTPEEQAKITEAKVIKLNEVKTVDLKSLKKRRDKKPEIRQALKKNGNTMRSTQVLLPASGYTAELLGCSPYEIMTLQQDEDPITDNELRWNLIWSKIKSTSIGIKSFEEFYNRTASDDYDVLIWGILRSTFEDIDTISLNCSNPQCKKHDGSPYSYEYKYSVFGLLRPEFITEKINAAMKRVVTARTAEEALEAHNNAPINVVETFVLPESGYIVEMGLRSANDFVNKSLTSLASENLEPQYRQSAILATSINEINIPINPEDLNEGVYTYDTPEEITEIIYNLGINDLLIVSSKASVVNTDVSFKFGFTDLVCPKCKTYTKFQPMDISTILFYRNALSMNVSVE